jgi:hypothetical protein
MAKAIPMEEFHVSIFVRRGLPETELTAIYRTLNRASFRVELRRAVGKVIRRHPALRSIRFTVTC